MRHWRMFLMVAVLGLSFSVSPSPASAAPTAKDRSPLRPDLSDWNGTSGGVRAKGSAAVSDAANDVPFCKGDVVGGTGSFTDGTVTLGSTTACPVSVNSDPAWTVGVSEMAWFLDTDGDGGVEYVTGMFHDGSALRGGVVFVDNGAETVTCGSVPVSASGTSFGITFPSSCIGGASSYRYAVASTWDENPNGDTCDCPEDYAPAFEVFSGSVANSPGGPPPPQPGQKRQGYWMIGRTGDTYAFGAAQHHGNSSLPADVVDLEPTPSGNGYRTVDKAGRVLGHGDAGASLGPSPTLRAGETVTAISSTRSGAGYWLFTSLGRVFTYGDAPFFGDMGATRLNGPVLDSIPTQSGNGYYMVASDGGIFTFGDATFLGSMGDARLNAPVQSLVPDDDGSGYWLVASDGGIFAFDAEFYGSMGSVPLNKPVTGMVGFGKGYLMVAEDGGIFTFGDAPFFGSLGSNPPREPIVSTAVLNR